MMIELIAKNDRLINGFFGSPSSKGRMISTEERISDGRLDLRLNLKSDATRKIEKNIGLGMSIITRNHVFSPLLNLRVVKKLVVNNLNFIVSLVRNFIQK